MVDFSICVATRQQAHHDPNDAIEWCPLDKQIRATFFPKSLTNSSGLIWQQIAKNLVAITKRVVSDLQYDGYRGRTITVKIKFSDFVQQTRAKTLLNPTDSLDIIRKTAFECLGRFELKKKMVRLIGLRVSGLEKVTAKK